MGHLLAEGGEITVQVDQPGIRISPMLYGLMTEEINHSYDGGLYAEVVQNRALKDSSTAPVHWDLVKSDAAEATLSLDVNDTIPDTALSNSLELNVAKIAPGGRAGIANGGFWGIPVRPNTTYQGSLYAKGNGPLDVDLESVDGKQVYAQASTVPLQPSWQHIFFTLKTGEIPASITNRLVLSTKQAGQFCMTQVSLFPPTYKSRPNGNRIDLMQLLAGLQPAFLRLPGGNYLEGGTIKDRFAWEKTVGPLEIRPGHQGPWGYRSSDGMGLLEFLEWCEDLHMEPVLAVYAGFSLGGEHVSPGRDLDPFVTEALEEIDYVMGDETTAGGKKRIRDGHPAPFPLHYVEIGNEDGFDRSGSYDQRFTQFQEAIKSAHPELQLIATAGVLSVVPDVMDDHYYRTSRAMAADSHHYDSYSRSGPKIFVGEWASVEGNPTPNMKAALGDAAWLTGLERNSDLVVMESYAPLLVNVNPGAAQWGTNLIGFDAMTSFGSPSYYVQKMFRENRGDRALPVKIVQPTQPPAPPPPSLPGQIGLGTWATSAEFKDITVTHNGEVLYQSDPTKGMASWNLKGGEWKAVDGVFRQSNSLGANLGAVTGDTHWTDYTYHVSAKKIAGNEGFLIRFHYWNGGNQTWLNVGGWRNSFIGLERTQDGEKFPIGDRVPFTVEANRWYDIDIELQGNKIRCSVDGEELIEADEKALATPPALYSTASLDESTGETLLKLVNFSNSAEQTKINLVGSSQSEFSGTATVLTSTDLHAVNSVGEPTKVVPSVQPLNHLAPAFNYLLPANSVAVLRLK